MFTSNTPNVIGGILKRIGVEITRPDNATEYTAKDVITDSEALPSCVVLNDVASNSVEGSGYIVGIRLATSQKTNAIKFRVHLYHTEPSLAVDNEPKKLLYVDAAKRIGSIDLPAMTTEDAGTSTSAEASDFTIRMPYHCANRSSKLYAEIECLTNFIPDASQKFYLEIVVDNN